MLIPIRVKSTVSRSWGVTNSPPKAKIAMSARATSDTVAALFLRKRCRASDHSERPFGARSAGVRSARAMSVPP
jgi:hypothetical protein